MRQQLKAMRSKVVAAAIEFNSRSVRTNRKATIHADIRELMGKIMFYMRWAIFAVGCAAMLSVVHAEPLKINGDSPRKRITVTMENTKMDSILKSFSEVYGFEIKGIENTRQGDPISASMTGSLRDILGRLLRNRNYLIVYSSQNTSGVEKVMILDSKRGVLPAKTKKASRNRPPEKTLADVFGASF